MREEEKIKTRELLKLIGLGVLIVGSVVAPNLPRVFLSYKGKRRPLYFNRRHFSQQIKRLQKRELIQIKEEGGKTLIVLSENGKKKILQYNFDEISIERPESWDRKWRMVIFDIPESFKKEREIFRSKLKELGFYRLQDSVFVFPFRCEKEIEFMREYLGIGHHVLFLTFKELERKTLPLTQFKF